MLLVGPALQVTALRAGIWSVPGRVRKEKPLSAVATQRDVQGRFGTALQ